MNASSGLDRIRATLRDAEGSELVTAARSLLEEPASRSDRTICDKSGYLNAPLSA